MPGHKGREYLGFEKYDITEITGADSLYSPSGIIKESESNASALFDAHTFYSCEGSSLSIRAMVYLASLWARENSRANKILAGRNAHKSFLGACALLNTDILWLTADEKSYLSCNITAEILENAIKKEKELPAAVYITTPDYLGNITDLCTIAQVCRKYNILLLADNAHGAYLKFLEMHPLDMGADMVADSAHKTLPVLTGGAYLHISKNAPEILKSNAKNAMSIFGSTSPSYLILESLDKANQYLEGEAMRLKLFVHFKQFIVEKLKENGFTLYGNEPLKLTIMTKPYGYRGYELARMLEGSNIFPEFYDDDFCVFMLTTSQELLMTLAEELFKIKRKEPIAEAPPKMVLPPKLLSVREALLSLNEIVRNEDALGRILAQPSVACPPAVPIVACGEQIDENAIKAFKYYKIEELYVVK